MACCFVSCYGFDIWVCVYVCSFIMILCLGFNVGLQTNFLFLSKILEKIVARQLHEHLHDNNLLDVFQSDFRNNHSTDTALL